MQSHHLQRGTRRASCSCEVWLLIDREGDVWISGETLTRLVERLGFVLEIAVIHLTCYQSMRKEGN